MDLTQSTDYMMLTENKLAEPFVCNDIVLFSGEIYKINRYWTSQKRILAITSKYVLNLKRNRNKLDSKGYPDLTGLSMKRIISVSNLKGVTKSLHESSFEFVIHVPSEYDYRYQTSNARTRDEIIKALKLAYLSDCKDDLPIYGVPEKYLGNYTQTSKGEIANSKIPDASFLLSDESININWSQSVGHSFSHTKQLSVTSDEDYEVVNPTYQEKQKRNSKMKKSKSAEPNMLNDESTYQLAHQDTAFFDEEEFSDEEQKLKEEISDDELDLSFNLVDEDIDIFGERSETIYSKYEPSEEIDAKDFVLKKLLRTTQLGKVYLAQYSKNKQCYALKSIKKDAFLKRFKSLDVLKDLSDQLTHPFI